MSHSTPPPPRTGWMERSESAGLFFIHAGAVGMWQVCFGSVLKAHGLDAFIPYAYATSGVSAFISPMIVGALADQHIAPVRLLRWLAIAAAVTLALAFWAIEKAWSPLAMLAFLQLHALCATPTWGLSTSIVLSRMKHPEREFGPVRAWATFGWMSAGWLVSWVLMADTSTRSGFAAAITWAAVAAFSLLLPKVTPVATGGSRSWRDLFGLEALALLRDRDHRVVFITAALYNGALSAFYPFTPIHLNSVGIQHATAAMSLGQISEIIAMFGLAPLLTRVRLKWIFLAGIGFGVLRYGLFIIGTKPWMLVGIAIHGFAFTLYFITAQLYLERRVDPLLRARAQALLTLMMAGFGSLAGSLGSGWWRQACLVDGRTQWPAFWTGMTAVTALVFIFFAVSYRGQPVRR